MKMKKLIYLLGIVLIFGACSSNSSDDVSSPDPDPNPNPDPNPTAKVTYDADIKNVISNNCLNCHGNPTLNGAPSSSSLTTYDLVKNRVDGIINRINRTGGGVMPPSGQMSSSTRALIQQWKDDGLLEN